MQSTMSEHASSRRRDLSCSSCHMRWVGEGEARHRSHRFEASRDERSLRAAISVVAKRTGETAATLTLTPGELGHAFPTGDLFRRLELVVEAVGVDWQVHARAVRYLTRHFGFKKQSGAQLRRVERDDRPLSTPVLVEVDLGPEAKGRKLVWRLTYQRVEHPVSEDPGDAVVGGEIVVASGSL